MCDFYRIIEVIELSNLSNYRMWAKFGYIGLEQANVIKNQLHCRMLALFAYTGCLGYGFGCLKTQVPTFIAVG